MSAHSHHHHHDSHDHHGHARDHAVDPRAKQAKLRKAFSLTLAVVLFEALGGAWSGSLALLTDAGHMAIDALALALAWAGAWYAARPADARRSYGYGRLEVLSGFVNAQIQLLLAVVILIEAIRRLRQPGAIEIQTGVMFWVALLGLAANFGILRSLHGHADDDLNSAGAVMHVLGDMLGAAMAALAALLIWAFGWRWADPVLSILVALLLAYNAWPLLRRAVHILLEGVPEGLVPDELVARMCRADPAIEDIHHLHVWQLASGQRIATLHAVVRETAERRVILAALNQVAASEFGIGHLTVQLESAACHPPNSLCRAHETGCGAAGADGAPW